KYQNERRSRLKCTQPPSRPSTMKTAARSDCSRGHSPVMSRNHCQLKYSQYIPICPTKGACRSKTDGFPYCPRLKLYQKALHVVGSPSLIGGKCAARIGCVRK